MDGVVQPPPAKRKYNRKTLPDGTIPPTKPRGPNKKKTAAKGGAAGASSNAGVGEGDDFGVGEEDVYNDGDEKRLLKLKSQIIRGVRVSSGKEGDGKENDSEFVSESYDAIDASGNIQEGAVSAGGSSSSSNIVSGEYENNSDNDNDHGGFRPSSESKDTDRMEQDDEEEEDEDPYSTTNSTNNSTTISYSF